MSENLRGIFLTHTVVQSLTVKVQVLSVSVVLWALLLDPTGVFHPYLSDLVCLLYHFPIMPASLNTDLLCIQKSSMITSARRFSIHRVPYETLASLLCLVSDLD